ncbi:MAG: SDR family NAD(P)-dependent oxidoreductase [Bacteroidota bacterium]|jgi:NAD(P)-dependent dehydrogenase (short-subunit alcohol dehydrogenase family)|nr:SDR family oxidoreductase [Ignavibacteria bacterium]MCU7499650.1 SDR family oxidoreductase [Ignavibacteria bacterium]MCU7512909.1 SDR family oxidoreductase [Ignavibacteria bacterium]MCU7521413.1 SDR family oxidoreductase [Ignavibacteria bacterium]MCU7524645.1 SDR family oxidoreductase [Ignavibacteria bacterium]
MQKELLIFGAGGELGRGVMNSFENKDFSTIYLFDRTPSKITFKGPNCQTIATGDLSLEEEVEKAFSTVKPGRGKLLFLFNTIGGFNAGTAIWETPLSQLQTMLKMNFVSSFLIARKFASLVKDSAGGSICFTSSMAASRPEVKRSSYAISKSALNYMVKLLALEGKEISLSANCVAPMVIDSPENRSWVKDESIMVTPEEIGSLVYSIFSSFRTVTGNVFELPGNLKIPEG